VTARACLDDDEIQAYLERTLAPADRAAVETHCTECEDCRELVATAVRVMFDSEPDTRRQQPPDALPVVALENYDVDAEIARGGIGRVSRARDLRLQRDVALKELHHTGPQAKERFLREAMITARLEHPAIVPVHEAGRWPSGEPFYTMKLVSGDTLARRIHGAETFADRLALLPSVLAVAEAAAYAHSLRIIHRDLKPSNVIVGQFGETVVVDWGLAKDLHAADDRAGPDSEPGAPTDTVAGTIVGTPAYMPPEQARGETIDERADVYALGAILYEVLAGVPPYHGRRDVAAVVTREAPIPVDKHEPGVPLDLLAIVRKAMARDPADRYPTAKELVADLRLFQTGRLVSARVYSRWALARRWLERHRFPVAIATIALIAVSTIGVFAITGILRERTAADRAQKVAEDAREQAEGRNYQLMLLQAQAIVDRDPTRALAWLAAIPASAPLWDQGRAVAVAAINRGYARHVWKYTGGQTSLVFSPDDKYLVSAGTDPSLQVIDLTTGRARALPLAGVVSDVAFARDGRMFAVTTTGEIAVFSRSNVAGDGGSPRMIRRPTPRHVRQFVAAMPSGRQLAIARDDTSTVELFDIDTGTSRRFEGPDDGVRDIAISPDGATIATIGVDRVLRLHDVATGATRELHGEVASHLAFTPDGTEVLVAELGMIREWTLATGSSRRLPFPVQRYLSIAVSPDGSRIAAAGFEGPIHLLDVASGQVTTLWGHDSIVAHLEFSADGLSLASAAMDHTGRLWQLPARRDRIVGRIEGKAAYPTVSPGGTEIAVGDQAGTIHRVPLASPGAPSPELRGHTGWVFDVAYSPDGRYLASQSKDRTIRLWDLGAGTSRVVSDTAEWVDFGRIVFSPDGRWFAASITLDKIAVFEVPSGKRACELTGGFSLAKAFDRNNRLAFTIDEEVRLGDPATCTSRTLYKHDDAKSAYMLAFSPDGRWLASASDDTTVGLYDTKTGRLQRLRAHGTDVTVVAFSPDSTLLASGGGDRLVRLWNVETGAVRILRGHQTLVASLAFSADGTVVASSGLDSRILLWDVATGASGVLLGHHDRISGIELTGRQLVSGSYDGTVRVWSSDPLQDLPVVPEQLVARLAAMTDARIDSDM